MKEPRFKIGDTIYSCRLCNPKIAITKAKVIGITTRVANNNSVDIYYCLDTNDTVEETDSLCTKDELIHFIQTWHGDIDGKD